MRILTKFRLIWWYIQNPINALLLKKLIIGANSYIPTYSWNDKWCGDSQTQGGNGRQEFIIPQDYGRQKTVIITYHYETVTQ